MSDIAAHVDAKAGYSAMCRRGEHITCGTARARCSCTCHGRSGQAPPGPGGTPKDRPIDLARPKEPPVSVIPMAEPEIAETPPQTNGTKPAEVVADEHKCPECGQVFRWINGLTRHLNQTHGISGRKAPARKKPARDVSRARPKLDAASVRKRMEPADDYDPWVLVVGRMTEQAPAAETLVLSTKADAEQVATLLGSLGFKAWRFRLADGKATKPT